MHTLAALLLAASAITLQDYVAQHCPDPQKEASTEVEIKTQLADKAHCLRDVMDRELDGFLIPLKKQDKTAFQKWMKVQADFNRWVDLACPLSDELSFWDLDTRELGLGTALYDTTLACQQTAFGQRAYFAVGLAGGTPAPFISIVDAAAKDGASNRKAWQKSLAEALASHATEDSDKEHWDALLARLQQIGPKTEALAREQCEALPHDHPLAGAKCVERVRLWLYSMIPLQSEQQ